MSGAKSHNHQHLQAVSLFFTIYYRIMFISSSQSRLNALSLPSKETHDRLSMWGCVCRQEVDLYHVRTAGFSSLCCSSRWLGTNAAKCWKPANWVEGNRYGTSSRPQSPPPPHTHTQSISMALQLAHWLASTNCRSHYCWFQPLPIAEARAWITARSRRSGRLDWKPRRRW